MTELAVSKLDAIADRLRGQYRILRSGTVAVLEQAADVGRVLSEAEAECHAEGASFQTWLRRQDLMPEPRARDLMKLGANIGMARNLIGNEQLTLDIFDVRKVMNGPREQEAGCVDVKPCAAPGVDDLTTNPWDDTDTPPECMDPSAEYLARLARWLVPPRLQSKKDWTTFEVRCFGLALLLGAVPDSVSMRQASDALGVSHDTIAKFVRKMSDVTGIRLPRQKSDAARRVYSDVQSADHWRRRER